MNDTRLQAALEFYLGEFYLGEFYLSEFYLGKMFVTAVNGDAPYPRPVVIASRVEIMKY